MPKPEQTPKPCLYPPCQSIKPKPTTQSKPQPCINPPCQTSHITEALPCLNTPCSTIQPIQTATTLEFMKRGKINGIFLGTGDQKMTGNMLHFKICDEKEIFE